MSPTNVVIMRDGARGLNSPVKATIERRIRGLSRDVGDNGLAFVYFSGHGVTRDDELYLIPQNGDEKTAIPLSYVLAQLSKSKAREKIMVIDTCRAAAEKGVVGIVPPLDVPANTAVFLSRGKGEKSYPVEDGNQSVYTRFFISALTDALEESSQPVIAQGLQRQLEEMMQQWRTRTGKAQTPQLISGGANDVILVPSRQQ